MKIKGLRWYIIGLIMMITIINYLDRGTLNYMWVANIDYELVEKQPIDMSSNVAVKTDKGYRLFSTRGDDMIVDEVV
jgi:ACS family hexuronate transporter-like MFS transporter